METVKVTIENSKNDSKIITTIALKPNEKDENYETMNVSIEFNPAIASEERGLHIKIQNLLISALKKLAEE